MREPRIRNPGSKIPRVGCHCAPLAHASMVELYEMMSGPIDEECKHKAFLRRSAAQEKKVHIFRATVLLA